MTVENLLQVADLRVAFTLPGRTVMAVDGISFSLKPGETLGVVGESGSGKSVSAYALVGLLAKNGYVCSGEIRFEGSLVEPGSSSQARLRGREIAFIFQNPRAALNPIRSVGKQICDVFAATRGGSPAQYRPEAIGLLDLVRIAHARERFIAYPHQLSGGMCQRVLIAMALAADPRLLIADEPTTGLDVTTQKVVMDILRDLGTSRGLATMLITHDLALAAQYCQRLAVMANGKIVETGTSQTILIAPRESYTQRLVAATPVASRTLEDLLPPSQRLQLSDPTIPLCQVTINATPPLLSVERLSKTFDAPSTSLFETWGRWLRKRAQKATVVPAVADVSFTLHRGEALGIVGESGSGKTTTARMIARLVEHSAGQIVFCGSDIGNTSVVDFVVSPLRRRMQVVFQDPLGSLNPRFTIFEAIRNPLRQCLGRLSRAEERRRVFAAAEKSGLPIELIGRFPHQLSGGQQARAGIARALVVEPDLLILDEPTSALDVSIQAVVLNQLAALRRASGITLIFVSHDLNVVRLMCERVLVMQDGRVVEHGNAEHVLASPSHPYTRSLVDAVPHLPIGLTSDIGQSRHTANNG